MIAHTVSGRWANRLGGGPMGPRFKILGHTGLRIGSRFDDQWGQPKTRGVLAALLLQPGRAVTHGELLRWVWPEETGPNRQALYTYVSRVREALKRMDAPPDVVGSRGTYRIDVDKADIDYAEFRRLVTRARQISQQSDHAAARDCLVTALDLWTERPLADLEGEQADLWRRHAETDLLIPAQGDLMHELMALGQFDEVLRRLADLPAEYQSHLVIITCRMEALFELHRVRDATPYYLTMRKHLRNGSGQAEADELTRFHDELLLRHQRRTQRPTIPANGHDAAATNPPVPHHLPHDVPDFTGRTDLLERLDQVAITPAATPARIVVLDGPAGVGKTSLAVHWCHQASSRFPDGQLYLNLHGFDDEAKLEPAAAIEQLLIQCGSQVIRPTTTAGQVTRLRNLINDRNMLVLLDNVASTAHVQSLLDALPCTVVITSRRRLTRLARRGVVTVPVPLLDHDDSRAWLGARLGERAHRETTALTDLVGLCGGNLLTMRLVGERIASRPRVRLAEFVDELRESLLDLGDDPDSPGGSLRATIDLSYQALDLDEQRALRLLGLHPGPDISLDAAAALVGVDRPTVKRQLDALAIAHLLGQPEQLARYRYHDLIRRFAAELVALPQWDEERQAAERRILAYYNHGTLNADLKIFPNRIAVPEQPVVAGVTPPVFLDDKAAVSWLVRELSNVEAAIQLASKLGFHSYVTTTAAAAGETYLRLGYQSTVHSALRAAIRSAELSGDQLGQAYSLSNLGMVHEKRRDFAAAESYYHRAKNLFDQIEFYVGSATSVHHLAQLHVERGDYRDGVNAYQVALAAFRTDDSTEAREFEVMTLYRLAEGYRLLHDLDAAINCAQQALWLAEGRQDQDGQASSLAALALTHYDKADLVTARSYADRSMVLHQWLPNRQLSGRMWRLRGMIDSDERDYESAAVSLRTSVAHFHHARDAMGEATTLELLGDISHRTADHDGAIESWSRALSLFGEINGAGTKADGVRLKLSDLSAGLAIETPEQTRPLSHDSSDGWPGIIAQLQ